MVMGFILLSGRTWLMVFLLTLLHLRNLSLSLSVFFLGFLVYINRLSCIPVLPIAFMLAVLAGRLFIAVLKFPVVIIMVMFSGIMTIVAPIITKNVINVILSRIGLRFDMIISADVSESVCFVRMSVELDCGRFCSLVHLEIIERFRTFEHSDELPF